VQGSLNYRLMTDIKLTVVRLTMDGDKFEILVKPDPALEYKLGKRTDLSSVLIADEIYSDANKGSRAASEKLTKHFKTTDPTEIAKQILSRGELSLTTEQRRKIVEEKKKQIIQYINKSFVDPKTHIPHPILRIESAMDEVRVIIDPFKRAEDQAKTVVDALRKILPLKSEIVRLTVTVPPEFSAQSYSVFKTIGNFKGEHWLEDGSLRVTLELNAGMKASFLDRLGSITKGSAQVLEV
jgi:ribosome maturation protein SDO1